MNLSTFELHPTGPGAGEAIAHWLLPDAPAETPAPPLSIAEADGTMFVAVGPAGLEPVAQADAVAAFRVVQRRLGPSLAMLSLRGGILVNSLPALKLSVLAVKDAVSFPGGCQVLVTERVRPYVGTPTSALLGRKCLFCNLEILADTHVVICSCGRGIYHHETAASHADLPEEKRLNCFEKVRACLTCGKALRTDDHLIWDPKEW